MNAEQDLRDGFPDYNRAPKDVVPQQNKDDRPLPTGVVDITHHDIVEDVDGFPAGIITTTERLTVTEEFVPSPQEEK